MLWQRKDLHSNAFASLQSPEGKRIASNLGLKDAGNAPECLTCHSDYVDASRRGKRYNLTEGVSCEACHGGAEEWFSGHVNGNTHAENIASGLYPLEDPGARAKLCLHCHMGSDAKPIDHRIMGAGHPPLDFELDSFTNNEWAHFRVDADYKKRKPAYQASAKSWAIGQLISAETFLDGLISNRFSGKGMFPELVFYDCHACHHPMQPPRWMPGVGGPLGPGEPRLADVHLAMVDVLFKALAPDVAKQWSTALSELHLASRHNLTKTRDAATKLRKILSEGRRKIEGGTLGKDEATSLILKLADLGAQSRSGDYNASKQIYWGIESLDIFLRQSHSAPKDMLRGPIDRMFSAVQDEKNYNPGALRAALLEIPAALSQPR